MAEYRSRKYLLTINNYEDHGYSSERVCELLEANFRLVYYCLSREIGKKQETPHMHVFFYVQNAIRFGTVKKVFPEAHIDKSRGTSEENRDYVHKTGKWAETDKSETQIPGSFLEWGTCPAGKEEHSGMNQMEEIYEMLKSGYSNLDIIDAYPIALSHLREFDNFRELLRYESYKTVYRDLIVTYRYGSPGVGKTRSVMDMYGYEHVYRITDYSHPFDGYRGQDVVIFEEFRSSLPIADMLKYLEGYPLELPARYGNKVASYTTVYIISNISLGSQYQTIQYQEPMTYKAFCRRIHTVQKMSKSGAIVEINKAMADAGFDMEVDDNPFK